MRILYICQGYPTKAYPYNGLHQIEYARSVKKYFPSVDVTVAVLDSRSIFRIRRPGFYTFQKDDIDIYCQNIYIGAKKPLDACNDAVPAAKKLMDILWKDKVFDIIHVHNAHRALPFLFLKDKNIPFVMTEHYSAFNKKNLAEMHPDYAQIGKLVYPNMSGILIGSPHFQKNIEQNFGVKTTYLPVITNTDAFHVGTKKADYFKIVSAGNLIPSKSFEILIQAYTKYFKGLPSKLHIYGIGPKKQELQQLISKLKMDHQIILEGYVSYNKLSDSYLDAHMFALISQTETFGKVYLEALIAGLPVITANNGGSEQFITQENGMITSRNDIDQIGHDMFQIFQHYDQYDNKKISADAQERFSTKAITKKHLDYYQNIIRQHHKKTNP